jgi:hypothetical protein
MGQAYISPKVRKMLDTPEGIAELKRLINTQGAEQPVYTQSEVQGILEDLDNLLGVFDNPYARRTWNKHQEEAITLARKNRQLWYKN